MAFTPVEEVELILVVPKEMVEREVRDFSGEEWVEEPMEMSWEDLVVVVVRMDREVVVEALEGTLVEAVEIIKVIPAGEGEDPITLEQIRKMIAATKQLAMVRSPLHYCKKI